MNLQTDECLESQTQSCCEGGRRPVSQAQLTAECGCKSGCVSCSTNGETVYRRPFKERTWLDQPSGQCVVVPVDLPEVLPMFSKEQVDKIAAIADGTDALLAERAKDYGPPEINMTGIGLIWTAQLRNHWGMPDLPVLSGQMVALMMAGLKLNRLAKSPSHQDSYDDLGGYAEIAKSLAK